MAVGPGGVPAGIDPSLLTSAAFELVQVGFEIIDISTLCNAMTIQRQIQRQEIKKNTKTETETKTGTR